ncbi:sulfurtransferase [Bacillus aquiflavi]|uniref:Sulfurtransferase n=1 Tax=Bacillus aquiflavi TaxID=2672567 RepID=A0A6B3VTJ2_9BACI|nr:sulfurtransferase [Bacillus aquiflavi]MBA4536145.1 sulfurtransferase [Bacillus aquiflavi]NEY80518.1 sulfurtransferase [Bacillus aquiflavi]UAC47015.1 sulfurtransferase [Bacillus aquiflavi]
MKHFTVEKEWLLEQLADPKIKIADCRFNLANPDEGRQAYDNGHIPRAVYFHLEEDLSGPVKEHGGRHPLPELEQLKKKLEAAGITNQTTVIVYDDGAGAFASRFWWLLTYMGHTKVYILNGGFCAWKEAGYVLTEEIPKAEQASFTINIVPNMLASYQEVKDIVSTEQSETVLIDSRERNRFLGIEEPIDKKAGHIPGAINKFWLDGFENGFFKCKSEQEKRFQNIDKQKPIVVYCGSGVTATPNFIALKLAGFQNVKLYAGSFSDWISYDENKINTGEN